MSDFDYVATAKPSHGPEYQVGVVLAPDWIEIGGVRLSWNDAMTAFDIHRDYQVQDAAIKKLQERSRKRKPT